MEYQTKAIPHDVTANQILSHPNFKHFLAYCLSYIILGSAMTCLGPMFPYLAVDQNRIETDYSFLLVCRASGFITGSIAMRIIGKRLLLHQLVGLGVAIMSVLCLLFDLTHSMQIQGAILFIVSIGCSFQDVSINLASLICFKGENMSVWLQVIHGAFGIGGLLGPFVVYIFQLNTYTFMGLVGLLTVLFYWYLETPEKLVDLKKQQEQDSKKIQLPSISIYLISAGFLFAVGQQTSFGGWISSYAVLWKFSTKEHATFYSSVYWISITAFRFVLAGLKGSPTPKIKMLALVGIFTTGISYFCTFVIHPQFGLIIMSILYGLCNSVLFPLMFTIPQQFGYDLTIKQSSVFVIWASLGQGCLAVGVGKTMQWFSYNWLLYSVCLFNIAIYILMTINSDILVAEKQKYKQSGALKKLQYADHFNINIDLGYDKTKGKNYELKQINK